MLISVCYSNPVCQLSQVESSANYGYLTDYYYNAGNLYKQRLSVILLGSLTVGYQKKVPAGRIKPAFLCQIFGFYLLYFIAMCCKI